MNRYDTIEDLRLLSETALESSLAGFWDWNMVTNEEYLSPRFKEMFGYSDSEMKNSPDSWQKIAYQEDLPEMFNQFEKHAQSHGKIPFNSIVRYYHKEGHTVWIKCTGKIVEWSENHEPLRAIGCHVDITEEKERENQLKKALNEREVLIREIHHRVKNNLQVLLSLTKLKSQNGKTETSEIEDSISAIVTAYEAIYMTDSIDDIRLDQYVEQIIKSNLFNQDIEYEFNCGNYQIHLDSLVPIGLILSELINNSIKHAFELKSVKKVIVNIFEEDDKIKILYRDNGIGYSNDVLEGLEQLNTFGLTILDELVNQLNGEIKHSNFEGAQTNIILNDLVHK